MVKIKDHSFMTNENFGNFYSKKNLGNDIDIYSIKKYLVTHLSPHEQFQKV
jgi:hypothetical protein